MDNTEAEGADDRLGHSGRSARREGTRRSIADSRGADKEALIAKFRNEMFNNVMPTAPQVIEGYHLCWGSTTNQSDTIARRQSLGYELVRAEELPGFEHITVTSGNYQGCVGCNELLLMKLPLDLYYEYMHIAHHERPMDHQMKMRQALETLQSKADGDGVPIQLANGSTSFLRASAEPRPMFTE